MDYVKYSAEEIQALIDDGNLKKMVVVKDVPVKVTQLTQNMVDNYLANGGYKTVVVDEEGKLFEETSNKKLVVGDYLVSNSIEGYENSYVVPAAKFVNLYTATGRKTGYDNQDIYDPVASDKVVYLLPKGLNVVIEAPWGGNMKLLGGVI